MTGLEVLLNKLIKERDDFFALLNEASSVPVSADNVAMFMEALEALKLYENVARKTRQSLEVNLFNFNLARYDPSSS